MYIIKVVHIKEDPSAIYIGRKMPDKQGSPLQNKYRISKDLNRVKCIQCFREDFYRSIQIDDPKIINELLRIHQIGIETGIVRLACWCKGKYSPNTACHGDVIKEFLESHFDYLNELLVNH